jgi:hypothetical protein
MLDNKLNAQWMPGSPAPTDLIGVKSVAGPDALPPEQMFAMGFVLVNGVWVKKDSETAKAYASTQVVESGSVVTSGSVLPAGGGPKPYNAAVRIPFIGGEMDRIRMTTGVGAGEDGPLTPIRNGITGVPRIIIDEQFT